MPSEKTKVYLDELDDRYENRHNMYRQIKIDELVTKIINNNGIITSIVDNHGVHVEYDNVISIQESIGFRTYFFGTHKIIYKANKNNEQDRIVTDKSNTSEEMIRKTINSYLSIGRLTVHEINGKAVNATWKKIKEIG
jgi:hypothetical protein